MEKSEEEIIHEGEDSCSSMGATQKGKREGEKKEEKEKNKKNKKKIKEKKENVKGT